MSTSAVCTLLFSYHGLSGSSHAEIVITEMPKLIMFLSLFLPLTYSFQATDKLIMLHRSLFLGKKRHSVGRGIAGKWLRLTNENLEQATPMATSVCTFCNDNYKPPETSHKGTWKVHRRCLKTCPSGAPSRSDGWIRSREKIKKSRAHPWMWGM